MFIIKKTLRTFCLFLFVNDFTMCVFFHNKDIVMAELLESSGPMFVVNDFVYLGHLIITK